MGYYPPYIPDQNILYIRNMPINTPLIKRVEKLESRKVEHYHKYKLNKLPQAIKKELGLGLNYDAYA